MIVIILLINAVITKYKTFCLKEIKHIFFAYEIVVSN